MCQPLTSAHTVTQGTVYVVELSYDSPLVSFVLLFFFSIAHPLVSLHLCPPFQLHHCLRNWMSLSNRGSAVHGCECVCTAGVTVFGKGSLLRRIQTIES